MIVPDHLRKAVMTVLFSPSGLARCDAAKEIAATSGLRKRILAKLFGESQVQKMLTSADRMTPALRALIEAPGEVVSLRRVFSMVYALTSKAEVAANESTTGLARNFEEFPGLG